MTASKVREKEKERVFEKQLLKERIQEYSLYGEQPKYVTAAYKQKLIDDKKWEYEEK
jgi:coiled-coil domain-containing protein 55